MMKVKDAYKYFDIQHSLFDIRHFFAAFPYKRLLHGKAVLSRSRETPSTRMATELRAASGPCR